MPTATLTQADRKLADDIARANPLERNAHVHPVFARLLSSVASAPADALAIQRAAYVSLLAKHDWDFQFSDDHSVYKAGREELAQLRMLQRELDPEYTLWNRHAPQGHRVQVAA